MVRKPNLKLVKLTLEYRNHLIEMLEKWNQTEEKIIPRSISRFDYRNFNHYLKNLEIKEAEAGYVPDSVYFALDTTRNIFVGAVNIRHYLTEKLLLNGGHIGYGIVPSERRKGYGAKMLELTLLECKKLNIRRVLQVCYKDNIASQKTIIKAGGILENEVNVDGEIYQRYWTNVK